MLKRLINAKIVAFYESISMVMLFQIIGGLVFFSFISFLSLLILPSLFGCFGFVLFWAVIVGLLMLFSISLKWILIFALIFYAIMFINKYSRYKGLPDYNQYLATNVNVFANGRVVCKHCGADNVMNQGLFGTSSRLRYYVCGQCRSWLCRFKVN